MISGATTYVPLLTQYVLPLPGTTTTTTTTTTGAVAAVRVDGEVTVVGEVAREEPRRTEPDRTDTGLRDCVVLPLEQAQ